MTATVYDIDHVIQRLEKLIAWEDAYPESVFPADLAKADELLKAGGMSLDSVSAAIMRVAAARAANDARYIIKILRAAK